MNEENWEDIEPEKIKAGNIVRYKCVDNDGVPGTVIGWGYDLFADDNVMYVVRKLEIEYWHERNAPYQILIQENEV